MANPTTYRNNSTLLAKVGKFLDTMYSYVDDHPSAFARADLTQKTYLNQTVFYGQELTLLKQVFGKYAATIGTVADRVIASDTREHVAKIAHEKLAHWALLWAKSSLQKDERFLHKGTLTTSQKSAWIDELTSQNRALLAIGSLSGVFGLKGVVLDTAWLLLICLKSVYQIALIEQSSVVDNPQLAYNILSAANLEKLQEKQVVLMALAVGQTLFSNTQKGDLVQELFKLDGKSMMAENYAKQFDAFVKSLHLEKVLTKTTHTRHVNRLLSCASVVVALYYNHGLLEQVVGTSKQTFCDEPVGLLEYQTDKEIDT